MISQKRLYDAFIRGGVGTAENYHWWTPVWGVRSKIWRKGALKKQARKSLGESTRTAIEEGNPESLRQLADALEWMMGFEREPSNARKADIFYAIEELNGTRRRFTTSDLLAKLNGELEAGVSARELDCELKHMGLEKCIPRGKKQKKKNGTAPDPAPANTAPTVRPSTTPISDYSSDHRLIDVGRSGIHQSGLFARVDIPAGTRVVEYIGDRVIKVESERRSTEQLEAAAETGDASVYIFTLNDRYDIDGARSANIARFANHSCDPNSETDVIDDRIWITAIRDIRKGAEVVYNYNFDLDCFQDHPCRCGSKNCVGYIAGEEFWPKLRKLVKKKEKKKARRKGRD